MSVKPVLLAILCIAACCEMRAASVGDHSYNIVIILADDLGYADLRCFGGKTVTPNIDRLAENGIKFTAFYASPICSPSRASLLTGCYPQRVGIPSVIGGNSREGIQPGEKLLPEMLKEKGYQTALFGKWHLGRREIYSPQNHGFDEFFGTLASNDDGSDMSLAARRYGQAALALYEGRDTVAVNPRQWELTRLYTERSVDFLARNKHKPFFLYLAYNAPHTPLFVGNEFAGKSKVGIYQDVLMEIDWSVGEIMKALAKNELTQKTLVVFMSDNGPWAIFGNHGGSGAPFSGSKKQTLEGGVRVPCIMSLPGVIPPARECGELVTMMDLYPTIAAVTGSKMTTEVIDGKDILALVKGDKGVRSPHEAYYYYYRNALQAVRTGRYKLQLSHLDTESPDPDHPGYDGHRGDVRAVTRPLALFDLDKDPGEEKDISAQNPEIVKKLQKVAAEARKKLGDSITGVKGSEIRGALK
jgi:arylsulfatase A